jgi:hypothetical protein
MMIISRYIYHTMGQGETPMVNLRTIVTLSENDKIWLENYSKITGISMAEAIRRGIAQLREREEKTFSRRLSKKPGVSGARKTGWNTRRSSEPSGDSL